MAADRRRSYEIVAPFYEELARVLSLGRIGRAKLSQLEHFAPGASVLYAGVGSGEDARAAVEAGFDVTAIDLSPRMLGRLQARLGPRAAKATLCCEDFRSHAGGPYDAIALNFFLNVFDTLEVDRVLDHALERLGLLDSAHSLRLSEELERVRCPTLVIAAELDGFVPLDRARGLAEAIDGASFVSIEGAGHAVVVEQPQRVADLCLEFLNVVR